MGPQLDRLVTTPITLVSIWSCHTGAGQDGADLLYALALRVGRVVRARTGFTFTNGQSTTFENGSVWQVATPDFKPAPIAAPTPHVTTSEIPMFEGTTQAYEFDDLSELKVQQFALGKRILASQTYSDADAVYIGSLLFLGPALEMQASIAGMITGHITLRFSSQEIIEFDVINDRLAVNKTNAVAYYLRSGINSLLQGD